MTPTRPRASSGMISGVGFAMANTIGSGFMRPSISAVRSPGADRPRNRSAPASSPSAALLWPAFLLGVALASGLSLSGHSAADAGSSWKSELADWVHLSAACLWIGGLVQLALVVWPLMPEARRAAFLAFSRLATVCVGVLLLAGVYLSILRLPAVDDLWTTGYGHVLLVKIGLVSLAFAWGGMHKLLAVPAVARGGEGMFGRLQRSLIGESMVGMAVLLVAAVLVDAQPPARPAPSPPAASSVPR